jgi:hypothetical protein
MSKEQGFNDALIQRILEIIPGVLIWILLLSPLWLGFSFPFLIINVLVVLSVYWVYRALILSVGSVVGYYFVWKAAKKDWLNECESLDRNLLPDPSTLPKNRILPKHLIVIANYGEEYDVIKRSIYALINQNYPKELIYLAVSIEERKSKKDEDYAKRGEYLQRDFGHIFGDRLFCFTHPESIPGEAIGAAANRAWGTKQSVELLEQRGEDINEFLITAPDGDLVFSKDYLASMTFKWLTSEKRNQRFYQTALYTFNNNYWDVPMLVRILMIGLTIPVLSSSVLEKNKRETWSCFSLNLGVMKAVNYWDTSLGIDDTTFFWRPYFHFDGDWKCEVFFTSLSADAVYNKNYFRNHLDQYKQYVRWGWGVITFPLAVKQLIYNRRIPLIERVTKIYHLFEVFVFWKVLGFLIAFGIPIVFFVNFELSRQVISITVPQTVSNLLTIATLFLIPNTIIKLLIIPPRPAKMSKLRYVITLATEIPLNIISLFTFGFLPFIESTTRMMLGQEHTKRVTWSEKQIAR